MRSPLSTALALLSASSTVLSHATFQQLWVNGIDQHGGSCVRAPASNSPVTDVSSPSIRCNASPSAALTKCAVPAGSTITIEMHQQAGDRSCANEGIGGAHYGPVMVYLSKVTDAASADGSGAWFKIYQDAWAKNSAGASGDDDFWGTKDLNKYCGKLDVKVPTGIPSGDYLLRSEVVALHTAAGTNGAQFYLSCYQITVTGGSGSSVPAGVSFPGAYKASDPGILVNIHAKMSSYTAPGPAVAAGGQEVVAGTGGSKVTGTGSYTTTIPKPTATAGVPGTPGGCSVAKYGQCGGQDYTGCTNCASGSSCVAVSPPHYYQCQ